MSVATSLSLPEWIVRLGEFVLAAWLILTAIGMVLTVLVIIAAIVLTIARSRPW